MRECAVVREPSPLVLENAEKEVQWLYDRYGQRKPMGIPAPSVTRPHYFLLRSFLGQNDLLVILNTKRCRYRCHFCTLPEKSSRTWVGNEDVVSQFLHVARTCRHALSILDRVTLSNEGSVLDQSTLGGAALDTIVRSIGRLRRVRRIDLETRLEFVVPSRVASISDLASRARIGILTGFETLSPRIRDEILGKRQSLSDFLAGLDRVAEAGAALTSYVLFKPDPEMSDEEAYREGRESISFLMEQCMTRGIPLQIRLNPMYRATGSPWARRADGSPRYAPPRLTDVMDLAQEMAAAGATVYIGLSTEGLSDDPGSFRARADYSDGLIRSVKQFNDRKIDHFQVQDVGPGHTGRTE